MIAVNLGLSLNVLQPNGNFGNCIADQAKYLGNLAHGEPQVFNVGNTAEDFGNGGLNIINL